MGLHHVGGRKSSIRSEESTVDDGVSSDNNVDHRETKAEVREINHRRAVIHAFA